MIITIIAEPRSGSTNLTNWFYFNKNFTTFFNPDIPPEHRSIYTTKWFQNGILVNSLVVQFVQDLQCLSTSYCRSNMHFYSLKVL